MMLRDHIGISVIIIMFLCANLIFLNFYDDVWWDSSVYIGMGKYLFSLGKSGLWEESRPLMFPLILGMGWKLGFDAVYFGRLVSVIFAILVVILTYKIGIRISSKKIGLLAAFFTAFSYNFLFFSPNILTEIPSTFFVLLAFYYFLSDRLFLMGLFSGIAVMTRLFQIFTLIGLGLVLFFYSLRKPDFNKRLFYAALGFLLPIMPYFLLNHYLYNDLLLPFKTQSHLTRTTGWMLYEEYGFYFIGLLKENFFMVFLLGIPFFLKKNHKFTALILMPLIYLFILSMAKHKEMRFMLVILPFLYLLASYCLTKIYLKTKHKRFALAFFYVLIAIWITMTFISFKDVFLYRYQRDGQGFLYFQNYLKNSKENVWITNPLYALYSDGKIDGLLYFYSSDNLINFIGKNNGNVETILFNNCDIPCPPAELDSLCPESRKTLYNLVSKFKKVYEKEINSCKYEIYRRITS